MDEIPFTACAKQTVRSLGFQWTQSYSHEPRTMRTSAGPLDNDLVYERCARSLVWPAY